MNVTLSTLVETPSLPFVDIRNTTSGIAEFDFYVNGNGLFSNDMDVIEEIWQTDAFEDEGFLFAAWEWIIDNRYHSNPYSADVWQHAPYIFFNSLGFGLCDDVATAFHFLADTIGYDSRVWVIEGHVIPEFYNNGRWEIYDPDLEALYITDTGEIAGYDYVSTAYGIDYQANILASEYAGEVTAVDYAYDEWLIDLYRSVDDNVIAEYAMTSRQDDFVKEAQRIALPPQSFARIHAYEEADLTTIYGDIVPEVSVLEVHFGSLQAFEFEYPLVAFRISGEGSVLIDGVEYVIGGAALDARLSLRDVPVMSIVANTTGSDNVISYLINPVRFGLDGKIDVALEGDVDALSVVLSGDSGDDVLSGAGGADTLLGGSGADWLTQTAAAVNGAAGSRLEGGAGDDRIEFAGSQAYTSNYVFLSGGDGNDVIRAGAAQGQYVGSIQIEGGSGADLIEVGHIEGSTGGRGYVSGGEGNDVLRVLDTWGGIGIWSNSTLRLLGDGGDDRFELAGTQLSVPAGGGQVSLDGGGGFDTLVWNGRYNLTIGGSQNPAVGLYAGYRQELKVSNVERVDLAASGATGLTVRFSAQDVATITVGSDFDRSTLGLGLSGTGETLFVNAGSNQVDLTGYTAVGGAVVGGLEYGIYRSGDAYLGVLSNLTEIDLTGIPTLAAQDWLL